jgi:cell division protein FtsA
MKQQRNAAPVKTRNGLIAALDIGTTKVCCLIGKPVGADAVRVVGIGHQASRGLRNGTFVDLDAAEATIRAAVESAERMAGDNIQDVVVNVSGGNPESRLIAYEISVAGHEIGDADVRRILEPASISASLPADHEIVHAIPVGYSIDGCRGVRDPRGMYGQRLGVNLHVITAAAGAIRNLTACVSRCHLEVKNRAVSSYAAAMGALVEEETALGVTLIEMGGGTTSVAVFFDSELVHTDSIPVGGLHVSRDIARGLSTPLAQAERIKTLFGSCLPSPSDDRQTIEVPPLTEESHGDAVRVPRSLLVNIIRPRLEEVFEMVRTRLEDAGFDRVAGRRLVLTGGACQLLGAPELAGMILDKQVRVGRPRRIEGLPDVATGPAFATVSGLLRFALRHAHEAPQGNYRPPEPTGGRWQRFRLWLHENFY